MPIQLDVSGAVTVTAALMLAVVAIVNGNEAGWPSVRTVGPLGVAAALLGAFLVVEFRTPNPTMPLGPLQRSATPVRRRPARPRAS